MGTSSSIEWTDRTWNPLVGCSRVSEGCRHCYAERFVHRGLAAQHRGLTIAGDGGKGPRWTGDVRLVPERLGEPLRWKKAQRVFVNSLSDLFHENVAFETIAAVFGVMEACPHLTFQVLTKRPRRAREFCAWVKRESGRLHPSDRPRAFPLPNLWLGVSVEDQRTADERIPVLLELPAALHFVSYEPALGPVDFGRYVSGRERVHGVASPSVGHRIVDRLGWIIVGGESGPGARPFDLAWARSTIEQCRTARVACFVKQLGARPIAAHHQVESGGVMSVEGGEFVDPLYLRHRKGADPAEWPEDLRIREVPQ